MSEHAHGKFSLQELVRVLLLLITASIIQEAIDPAAVGHRLLPKQVFEVHFGQALRHGQEDQQPCREPRDRRAWNVVWFWSSLRFEL